MAVLSVFTVLLPVQLYKVVLRLTLSKGVLLDDEDKVVIPSKIVTVFSLLTHLFDAPQNLVHENRLNLNHEHSLVLLLAAVDVKPL